MKNWERLEADENLILTKHYTPGRAGHRIDKVIIHHNGGNLSIRGCFDVWQTREASAHYQVDQNGRIGQLVYDSDTAWHAGNQLANQTSIGIEHADISSNPWKVSDATLDAGAHLVAAICKFYGLGRPQYGKNVFWHKDFSATECPASLAGSQRDAYLKRAQEWYDRMVADSVGNTDTSTIIKEEIMAGTTHIVFQKKGTQDIYIANLMAGTYARVPDVATLKDRLHVLRSAGMTVKTWDEVRKKGSGYGTVENPKAFGTLIKDVA